MNKDVIRSRFQKSIKTYKQNALVQKQVCGNLCDKLNTLNLTKVDTVFEIACGTGFLTQRVLDFIQPSSYFINDLVKEVEHEIKPLFKGLKNCTSEFMPGDAENISYPTNMDMIISASAFQWFENLDLVFSKINKSLKKGGVLAFSSFGPDNYKEIRSILNKGLEYTNLPVMIDMLSNDFEILYSCEYEHKMYFDTAIDVLRHIKLTGVNGNADNENKSWGRNQLRDFTDKYKSSFLEDNNMMALTYNPIIIIAKKK